MIDREQATKLVVAWLADHPADGGKDGPLELFVLEDETMEADFGWIFFYASRLHRKAGDYRYLLAGNAPLIVDRADGSLHQTGTAEPIEYYIDEYRRQWKGPLAHYRCPCCGFHTLPRQPGGTFDLCPVCFWEDDPIQFEDHEYEGGANTVNLRTAQENFRQFGASERRFLSHVRPPLPDEMPT
jgi:hypothetical protein